MTFDEAYQRMRQGAAIARPGWKKIEFLFWAHGAMKAKHRSGYIQNFAVFNGPGDQDDWFIVQATIPRLEPPKPKKPQGSKGLLTGSRLAARQAEMRRRSER